MTGLTRSRAGLQSGGGREACGFSDVVLGYMAVTTQSAGSDEPASDARMEFVNKLRASIARGEYFVSSEQLAQKLLGVLREGSSVQTRGSSVKTPDVRRKGELPFEVLLDGGYATFRAPQASESAEEENDERVGKADRNGRT